MRISDWSSDVCSSDLVTPEVKEELWSALTSLARAPPEERTLTGLSVLLQSNALKAALLPYTLEGQFGRLLDAAVSSLALSDVQCFETAALIHTDGLVVSVVNYMFPRPPYTLQVPQTQPNYGYPSGF